MEFEVLKGTKDFEPIDQIKVNFVIDTIKKNFESYGFRPFDTPVIEYLSTLTNKYDADAEIVQEIFKVTDRGERELGLRYDLTIPLCRYIAGKKQLKMPFRRYQVAKVFRDGPIKAGRPREFAQCDADVVGIEGREIEAELLSMFYESYVEIGIKAVLEVNNNKILKGALLQAGFQAIDLPDLTLIVDKLKKIGEEGIYQELDRRKKEGKPGFKKDIMKKALELLTSKDFKTLKSKAKNDLLLEGIKELEELVKLLDSNKVKYRINFSMSRGFNYYTGNIWEAYDSNEKITSSIGSGGRYDEGIGNYIDDGKSYPAVGVSFGLIPILECLQTKSKEGLTDILVVPLEQSLVDDAFALARKFRNTGKNTEIYYFYKIKKAFEYAEYLGCEEVAIIGAKDKAEGKYTLKNIVSGKEDKLKL